MSLIFFRNEYPKNFLLSIHPVCTKFQNYRNLFIHHCVEIEYFNACPNLLWSIFIIFFSCVTERECWYEVEGVCMGEEARKRAWAKERKKEREWTYICMSVHVCACEKNIFGSKNLNIHSRTNGYGRDRECMELFIFTPLNCKAACFHFDFVFRKLILTLAVVYLKSN